MTALNARPASDHHAPSRPAGGPAAAGAEQASPEASPAGTVPASAGPPPVLSRPDAVLLFGAGEFREALATGEWVELWEGVVVSGRRVHDPAVQAAAALLRAGPHSVLSGPTAVAMHGCSAAAGTPVHVTVPYDRQPRSRPGLVVHQGRIGESDVVELDGLRTHALDIALTDLLCTGSRKMALDCLKQAFGGLDTGGVERLRGRIAERLGRRVDRRGTKQAAAVLALARDSGPLGAVRGIAGGNRPRKQRTGVP
ncbi:hypothetical protein DFQ14_106219 [Halopolyspora algeriensis]|uniref:Transcriptional regulator with AbiEi antitoxin domain of type IV toxin-antitoxin system n=1 Tax=Halopolyspora algeriensis TaxID=1500506 RepID=A0A368VPS9_9ACTN|nr:hypothetical protein [Halopolyspora algeriensis]RCW43739.1 hypothetical protein DFQ14_106219 [Halopolyspora algeriensis]TQM47478.1 hypothetical protein FHU43_3468 [Halopolyspora algeriensis]